MYVAVRRYEGVSDPQKVARLVDEGFVPIISEMPGFVAYYFADAGDGVMVSTGVFEHKDAEEPPARIPLDTAPPLFAPLPLRMGPGLRALQPNFAQTAF